MPSKNRQKEKTKPLIYIVFIGGAADKESFLWKDINLPFQEAWPHKTMYVLAKQFNLALARQVKRRYHLSRAQMAELYRCDYVSYSEVCPAELKHYDPTQGALPRVPPPDIQSILDAVNHTTHLYIVGHSLGGWNGAHLSYILNYYGYPCELLVTLDPVGMGNHEFSWAAQLMRQAKIYTHPPRPVAKAWWNIRAFQIKLAEKQLSPALDDWVAWAGGQWLIEEKSFRDRLVCNEMTTLTHRAAQPMFSHRTAVGTSAKEALIASILTVADRHFVIKAPTDVP